MSMWTMYDALTARYTFACPRREHAHVALSSFRLLERLPGATHPAVYSVRFDCGCGDQHQGLIAHDDLDWAPLGMHVGPFVDLMTSRTRDGADELLEHAASHLRVGEWPWSFFCYPEGQPRPVFPSSFTLLAPGTARDSIGLLVRCPSCSALSLNLVSGAHVDVPFHNDREVGIVEHVFEADAEHVVEHFTAELYSSHFDSRRLGL
jgi:hypothetical protein